MVDRRMKNLPSKTTKCEACGTSLKDANALASHRRSHGANEVAVASNPGATTPNATDESKGEARNERELAEGQRNDRTNALANRATLYNHRDNSECEVNPDQTPRRGRTIRPGEHV